MKKYFSILFSVFVLGGFAQDLEFKKNKYEWPHSIPRIVDMPAQFEKEDVVILNEDTRINCIGINTFTKNTLVKINTEAGLKKFTQLRFPESFDIVSDKHFFQQGMDAAVDAPYIYRFKFVYFASRILKPDGRVVDLPIDLRTQKAYWVRNDGTILEDFLYFFSTKNLEVGDVLEYSYKMEYLGLYGTGNFYFAGEYPKLNSTIVVKYAPVYKFETYDVIGNVNGAENKLSIFSEFDELTHLTYFTYSYHNENVPQINYPENTRPGKQLPHFFIDEDIASEYGEKVNSFENFWYAKRGPKFEWLYNNAGDSLGYQETLYDKQHASLRKFLSKISSSPGDASYYTALCDSLNAQKFVSNLNMKYGGNSQYALSSGEWLAKGKIVEEFVFQLYWQLLNEQKQTTYFVVTQDKRLGETRVENRAEKNYEWTLLGVPDGNKLKLILPRFLGLKYNQGELPFYLEASNAAVLGVDYNYFNDSRFSSCYDYYRLARVSKFIKTAKSSENENVRTENGVFKISEAGTIVHAEIKENLNAQFSTLLRSLYLHDAIDSTVNPVYFRKCTDKPNSSGVVYKLSSKANTFPFKHSFVCSEDIAIKNPNLLDLHDWFSFTLTGNQMNGLPNYDYYFDFKYSDMYNFLFQFEKPVVIENESAATKALNNKYFELNSKITKQSDTSYLLSVMVKMKQEMIPKEDGQLLLDFIKELDELNSLSLKISK